MVQKFSNGELAPVVFFVFNRPDLTRKVFERIRAARPQKLLVIADGPRVNVPGEAALCGEVRSIVSDPDWPCELVTNFSERNMGCKWRLSSGLDWAFQACSEAIILEDDCIPALSFFSFCSEMLQRYRDDARITHVSGSNFQNGHKRGSASYFFSRYPLSWGWATWQRAWRNYDFSMSTWPDALRQDWLRSVLPNRREYRYWNEIFRRSYAGMIDTWDYQWVYACWRAGGLAIQPNCNLVSNIGVGADATHFRDGHSSIGLSVEELGAIRYTNRVQQNERADRYAFDHHIASKEILGETLFDKIRNSLAFRTRLRNLFGSDAAADGQ
jgi:hypothetical protein